MNIVNDFHFQTSNTWWWESSRSMLWACWKATYHKWFPFSSLLLITYQWRLTVKKQKCLQNLKSGILVFLITVIWIRGDSVLQEVFGNVGKQFLFSRWHYIGNYKAHAQDSPSQWRIFQSQNDKVSLKQSECSINEIKMILTI